MKLAALLRVSSEDRETLGSIQTQEQKITHWAEVYDHEITAWYPDDDVSGMLPLEHRPHGGRLLREAPLGQFEGVVVYRLDRLGRSFKVIFDGLDHLEKAGLRFVSATENFDTVSPAGRAMLGMLATFAGFERDTFIQRTADGKAKWANAGCWLGGIVPYGYTLTTIEDRKFLVPSTEILDGTRYGEADVVRQIFGLVVQERLSSWRIAQRLAALGIPTHSQLPADRPGRKRRVIVRGGWTPSQVRDMIANPTYKGLHVYGGKRGQKMGAHPRAVAPIVDEALWDAAQRQMDRNRERAGRPAHDDYLLRGLVVCRCGARYIGTRWPFGKRSEEPYYKCGGKHLSYSPGTEHLKQRGCHNRALAAHELEGPLWEQAVHIITHSEETLARMQEEQPDTAARMDRLQDQLDDCARRLEDLRRQENEILTMRVRRQIDDAQRDEQQARIDAEKLALLAQQQELTAAQHGLQDETLDREGVRQAFEELAELVTGPHLTASEKQYVLRRLVKRIEVDAPTSPGRSPNPPADIHVVWRVQAISEVTSKGNTEYCFRLPLLRRPALSLPVAA
jgi:site-specific DNA recombinase